MVERSIFKLQLGDFARMPDAVFEQFTLLYDFVACEPQADEALESNCFPKVFADKSQSNLLFPTQVTEKHLHHMDISHKTLARRFRLINDRKMLIFIEPF